MSARLNTSGPGMDEPLPEFTGYLRFVADRVRRGAMSPVAFTRIARVLRQLPGAPERQALARFVTQPSRAEAEGPLAVFPASLGLANCFVAERHRHHQPVVGHVFALGLRDAAGVRGYVIVGRPVARALDDGHTLEVARCCTDGVRNGCSKLYAAARREALIRRFSRLITYTLPEEGGASLRAAGWRLIGPAGGGHWSRASRQRNDQHPTDRKWLWEAPMGDRHAEN